MDLQCIDQAKYREGPTELISKRETLDQKLLFGHILTSRTGICDNGRPNTENMYDKIG